MRATGTPGSIITLLCDSGSRYTDTYKSEPWLQAHGLDPTPWSAGLDQALATGEWASPCTSA